MSDRRLIAVVALALITIATAWAIIASRQAPKRQASLPFGVLGTPSESMMLCTPARGGVAFDGTNPLRNDGPDALTIDSVALVRPQGLEVRGSYLAPIYNTTLLGNVPPTDNNRAWRERTPAVGAIIPPLTDRNLVLELRIVGDQPSGTADEIEVLYHDGSGHHFRFLNHTKIRIGDTTPC
jgi:hypothetical protein